MYKYCCILSVLLAIPVAHPATGAEEPDKALEAIVDKALKAYVDEDAFAAVEYVCTRKDTMRAAQAFKSAMRRCYWKKRDLTATLVFARAGYQYCLTAAASLEKKDPQSAEALRAIAKSLVYDIASFTWPGWDEKGIEIGRAQMAEGLQAAQANLRLAISLKKDALPMSRAYWMLGAQQLAAGNIEPADQAFLKASDYAEKAGSQGEALLSRSFACLTEGLEAEEKEASIKRLESLLDKPRRQKDGELFVQQVETARRVFTEKVKDLQPDR